MGQASVNSTLCSVSAKVALTKERMLAGGVAGGGAGAFVAIVGGVAVVAEAAIVVPVAVACAGVYAAGGALAYAAGSKMSSKLEAQSEWYQHLHENLTKCVDVIEGQKLQVRGIADSLQRACNSTTMNSLQGMPDDGLSIAYRVVVRIVTRDFQEVHTSCESFLAQYRTQSSNFMLV